MACIYCFEQNVYYFTMLKSFQLWEMGLLGGHAPTKRLPNQKMDRLDCGTAHFLHIMAYALTFTLHLGHRPSAPPARSWWQQNEAYSVSSTAGQRYWVSMCADDVAIFLKPTIQEMWPTSRTRWSNSRKLHGYAPTSRKPVSCQSDVITSTLMRYSTTYL